MEQVGACLLVNPGDLLGKDHTPSFALVDLAQGRVCREEVGEQLVVPE